MAKESLSSYSVSEAIAILHDSMNRLFEAWDLAYSVIAAKLNTDDRDKIVRHMKDLIHEKDENN